MQRDEREAANAHRFDDWADRGRGVSMAEGHDELVAFGLDRWSLEADAYVLDVGCGVGRALQAARARGAGRVAGIDVSPKMIAAAQATLPEGDLRVGSAEALPWPDGTFSHAISIESLYYHHDPVQSLREIARVLQPGGRMGMAIELYADNTGAHAWVDMMDVPMHVWSTGRWRAAFAEASFDALQSARIVRSTPVPGPSAFTPSAGFPTHAQYATYLCEGALWVEGRVPTAR